MRASAASSRARGRVLLLAAGAGLEPAAAARAPRRGALCATSRRVRASSRAFVVPEPAPSRPSIRSRSFCAPARSASARATCACASRTSSTREPASRSRSSASACARSARAAPSASRVSVVSMRASSWPAADRLRPRPRPGSRSCRPPWSETQDLGGLDVARGHDQARVGALRQPPASDGRGRRQGDEERLSCGLHACAPLRRTNGGGAVGGEPPQRQLLEVAEELGEVGHRRQHGRRPWRGGGPARSPGRTPGCRRARGASPPGRRGGRRPSRIPRSATRRVTPRTSTRYGQHARDRCRARAPRARTAPGTRAAARARPRTLASSPRSVCGGVLAARLDRLQPLGHLGEARGQDRLVEPALAAEVVADQRLVDAGAGRHGRGRDAVEAALGEERGAGREQRGLGRRRRPSARRCRGPRARRPPRAARSSGPAAGIGIVINQPDG